METNYRNQFFDKRTDLLESILVYLRRTGIKGKDFWSLKRNSIRFCLGESDYDLKIPFIFGGESEEIFDEATKELASLMKGRLEPSMVYDSRGSIMISVLDERYQLMPKTYRVIGEFKSRLETELAVSSIYSDSLIDAGIIASWLAPTLSGRRFISEIFRIYKKAIEEEMRLGGTERTSLLIHLAVSAILTDKKEILKGMRVRGVSYEKFERSVSVFYSNIVRLVISEILSDFKGKQLSYDFREMEYLLLSTTTPFYALNIKTSLLGGELNPYNLTLKIAAYLEEVYNQAARKSQTISDVTSGMIDLIMQDKKLTETVLEFHSLSSFRDDIINYLLSYDNQREGIHILLSEIAQDEKLLLALWEDSKIASQVETGLSSLIDRYRRNDDRIVKIRKILTNFKTHRKWGMIRLFSVGRETIVFQISEIVKRYIVYRMDMGYDSYLTTAKRILENKKRVLPLQELIKEYEAGRLYRFSGDHKIFLIKAEEMKEGHLFVDLKGFTKRTKRSGSLVLADFLRNEFFVPILAAAKRYHLKIGKERSLGIELNNLLGDAISFSGNVIALMELAKEIQLITSEYKKKLVKNNPDFDEKILYERLHSEFINDLDSTRKERNRIIETIEDLNRIIEAKRSMSPQAMLEAQMQLFDDTIQDHINAIALASQKVAEIGTQPDRDKYLARETELREQLSAIKESKDEMITEVKKQDLIKRSNEFYSEICQDEINQVDRLKGMLDQIQMKTREMNQIYYERLGEIMDIGVNTGLYISYGGVSEIITIYDDLWGEIKVNIADKINEASRGSQRNKSIKKQIDRFLEKKRIEMKNPNLIYPFNVIVASTLGVIYPLGEGPDRFSGPVSIAIHDDRDTVGKKQGRSKNDLTPAREQKDIDILTDEFYSESTDIYNLGEALSEEALREYIKGSRDRFYFFDRRIQCENLDKEFNRIFAYNGTEIYLIFGVEQTEAGRRVEMFRYAGILDYAGTQKREVTEVYEIIRPDSLFFLFIMDRHFDKWYEASRSVEDVREGLLGT